jgi:hypothetical protein
VGARVDSPEQRLRVYHALNRRNRRVAVLRVAVPALGAAVLLVIAGQMALAGLKDQFGLSSFRIDRNSVHLDAPRYAGRMADGSSYLVTAKTATASVSDFDRITLGEPSLVFDRADGRKMTANAQQGTLSIQDKQLDIDGITQVADSSGSHGTLEGTHVDWPGQQMSVNGSVHVVNAAGSTLDANSLQFDAKSNIWTFHHVTLTILDKPGALD